MNAITEPNPIELRAMMKLGIEAHAECRVVLRRLSARRNHPAASPDDDLRGTASLRSQAATPRPGGLHLLRSRGLRLPPSPQTGCDGSDQLRRPASGLGRARQGSEERPTRRSRPLPAARPLHPGKRKAFSIVRVPSEDEERDRAFTRQRHKIAPTE